MMPLKPLQFYSENAWPQVMGYYLANYTGLDNLNFSVPPHLVLGCLIY